MSDVFYLSKMSNDLSRHLFKEFEFHRFLQSLTFVLNYEEVKLVRFQIPSGKSNSVFKIHLRFRFNLSSLSNKCKSKMALCLRQVNTRLPTINPSLIYGKRLICSSVTFDRYLRPKVIKAHKIHSQTIQKLVFYILYRYLTLNNLSFSRSLIVSSLNRIHIF